MLMKKGLLTIMFMLANAAAVFATADESSKTTADTTTTAEHEISWLRRLIRGFDRLDTNYIEPQHYVFTAMLQSTHNFDYYKLSGAGDNALSVTFAPDMNTKIGPYIGWKWFFLGYTFDLRNLNLRDLKQQLDLCIYSSQIGIDLFYRRTGSDYKLREVSFPDGRDDSRLVGLPFDGVRAGITGFNIYYIFNHGRFSYPAAFAQSTCQKISCGSWLTGIGYTNNSLDFDYDRLNTTLEHYYPQETVPVDSGLMFQSVRYDDISISGGYAYNWVFARNWLLAGSLQAAVAYKKSSGDMTDEGKEGFSFENFNFNGIGRFGLVYNNTRWYAGFYGLVRSYHYHKSRFSTNNTFGSINLYAGLNFGLKKKYRKK
jgi:hypothetical protein